MQDYIDNNLVQMRSWFKDLHLHKRSIKHIKESPSTRIDNAHPKDLKIALIQNKIRARQSLYKKISYENIKLVREISDVVTGPSFFSRMDSRPHQKSSLNSKFVRQQNRRIKNENLSFGNKLLKVKSNYSTNKMLKDYQSSRIYKRLRSKPHIRQSRPPTSLTSRDCEPSI